MPAVAIDLTAAKLISTLGPSWNKYCLWCCKLVEGVHFARSFGLPSLFHPDAL